MLVNLEIFPHHIKSKKIKPAAKESIWRTERMQQVLPCQLASAKTWLGLKDFERPSDFLRFCNFPARCGLSKSYVIMSVVSGVVLPCFTTMPMFCRAGYTLRWDLCRDRVPMESSHVVRCQGKFLVGCDGGRSNVRCGLRIRWPLDSLGSGWNDYTDIDKEGYWFCLMVVSMMYTSFRIHS